MSGLTGRRIDFVRLVLDGMSPKRAAITAGYSREIASRTARRLLAEPAVADALERARAEKNETIATLKECKRVALDNGDAGAAIEAVKILTKMRVCGVV